MLRPRYAAALVLSVAAALPAAADPSCDTAKAAVQKPSHQMDSSPLAGRKAGSKYGPITDCDKSGDEAVSAGQDAACTAYNAKALPPAPSISTCLSGILNFQVSQFTIPSLSGVLSGLATKVGNMACSAVQNSVNGVINNVQQGVTNAVNNTVNGAVNSVTNAVTNAASSAINGASSSLTNPINSAVNGAIKGATGAVNNAVQQGVNNVQQDLAGSSKGAQNAPQSAPQNPRAIPPPPPSNGIGNLFSNH